jgi:hypothetical protein
MDEMDDMFQMEDVGGGDQSMMPPSYSKNEDRRIPPKLDVINPTNVPFSLPQPSPSVDDVFPDYSKPVVTMEDVNKFSL